MNIKIEPSLLNGTIKIPSSKSYSHRMLICAALSKGKSIINGVTYSKDIDATICSLKALGAIFEISDNSITVTGITNVPSKATINCCESGSTLRFLIPIAAALGVNAEFIGEGRLPQRPIDIYIRELSTKGIEFAYNNTMPFLINGKLNGGIFEIEGDVSSQFITGLLFALPLLKENSEIILKSKLESKPYADMTIESLKMFGIHIDETDNGYKIQGGQTYKPANVTVEGDYSQAAFFYVANAIGNYINIENVNPDSNQGDKKIVDIIEKMCYNENGSVKLGNFNLNCADIPDLVPILAVLGCFGNKESRIYNAERLRIKESDRLTAIAVTLNKIGGKVTTLPDGLIIEPVDSFCGGVIDSFNDHRIVMCAAIAATKATGTIYIKGADTVEKSYPNFFADYIKLGGNANVITLE